jgi:hypothetical protein
MQHGYNVLEASNGEEALQVAGRFSGQIHLLLTDVVMPKMEGTELAGELAKLRPGISTLFMSGYTAHRLLEPLSKARRPVVLQKPLHLHALLEAIGKAIKNTP